MLLTQSGHAADIQFALSAAHRSTAKQSVKSHGYDRLINQDD
jgi:hypothetical protein